MNDYTHAIVCKSLGTDCFEHRHITNHATKECTYLLVSVDIKPSNATENMLSPSQKVSSIKLLFRIMCTILDDQRQDEY